MSASHDTTVKKKVELKKPEVKRRGRGRNPNDDSAYFTYNFLQQKEVDYRSGYDMGEFLYRLHFLAQLNVVPIRLGAPFGYLLAGVVSFILKENTEEAAVKFVTSTTYFKLAESLGATFI